MDEERRKKIEAGKLKLAEFKKRRSRNKTEASSRSQSVLESATTSTVSTCNSGMTLGTIDETSMEESLVNSIDGEDTAESSVTSESSLQIPEDNDELEAFLNSDEVNLVSLLKSSVQKNKKYQAAISHKEALIQQLTQRLKSATDNHETFGPAGDADVVNLKKEVDVLRLQMKEAAEMLAKQKARNEITEQNQINNSGIYEDRKDAGVETENSIFERSDFSCLSVNSILNEDVKIEDFLSKFYKEKPTFKYPFVQQLENLVEERNKLKILVQNLNCQLNATEMNMQHGGGDSNFNSIVENEQRQCINDTNQSLERSLDKLSSLYSITKLIESLLNVTSYREMESVNFSPSKFQSFFLRRLNSGEDTDALPNLSEGEFQTSDINYAEVDVPYEQLPNGSHLSIERLRDRDISNDLSQVADYLNNEMNNISTELNSSSQRLKSGSIRDSLVIEDVAVDEETIPNGKICENSLISKIQQQRTKVENSLKHFNELAKEVKEANSKIRQRSVESDTLTNSDDNLLLEEPPLSCLSLVSLTDSEYRTDCITTDSETNTSRKVSIDIARPMQDRECIKCEKYLEFLKEKHEEMCNMKETLEIRYSNERIKFLEKINMLEEEQKKLNQIKENLDFEMTKQIELLCKEHELKINHLSSQHNQAVISQEKEWQEEKENLFSTIKKLEESLTFSNNRVEEVRDEKAKMEYCLQNQIADLVQEHEQDMEALKEKTFSEFNKKQKLLEDKLNQFKQKLIKEHEDKENNMAQEHLIAIKTLEAAHTDETADFQKKIEQLLEEKCELLSKTTEEFQTIMKKNHDVLAILCHQLQTRINMEQEKMRSNTLQSHNGNMDLTFPDVLEDLNRSIESGIMRFLNQNYFTSGASLDYADEDTQYLSQIRTPPSEEEIFEVNRLPERLPEETNARRKSSIEIQLSNEEVQMIEDELIKLKEEFQRDVSLYKSVTEQYSNELKEMRKKIDELNEHKENLQKQLDDKEKIIAAKETQIASMDVAAANHAAQTSSRLLNVLSDLVKTFIDIENDINDRLKRHGLIPPNAGMTHHDDETGQSIGSREDFTSFCSGEALHLELTEDGPDLTPRAWDLFSGSYDADLEEDVVLRASRRLRLAVDSVLNLLSHALDNQQVHDLKLLLKRNEELSQELREESQDRDTVHMQLVNAESALRKLEAEKRRLEDLNVDLKENQSELQREINSHKKKLTRLEEQRDNAYDKIHTLKEQCDILSSRLGDPEKKLLQENTKLSSDKYTMQKHLSMEKQSLQDKLHQMAIALDEANNAKDELLEKKCKEILDLKAEMEAMDKQMQSNRRFIEEQAQEREQEREEFMKEINKMQDFVREKDKIQSNEARLTKEIDQLEQLLRARIKDHKIAMSKKDEIEKELRQSVDKIHDLREIIEELEKQLELKAKYEAKLKLKLSNITESVAAREKENSSLRNNLQSNETVSENKESIEKLRNLEELLASRSQELKQTSQSQALLQELRGQLHFLETKVDHRVRQLEATAIMSLSASPVQSDDTSRSESQDGDNLHIPYEDGWEMSPRSIHWLEVRRLEEKIGHLAHLDEELIRKNKDLELQLKKLKAMQDEQEHDNTALREQLSEQLMQVAALKSHIDEQKHKSPFSQKSFSANKKIEELQDVLQKQIEKNQRITIELQEAQDLVMSLRDEIHKKDEVIDSLMKSAPQQATLEELNTELSTKQKTIDELRKTNVELDKQIEKLKDEASSSAEELENAKQQIEMEKAQVETLCQEMFVLTNNSKRLEQDFYTVQDMVQQKEQELATLQEETETQMQLEAHVDTLEQTIADQKKSELELQQRVEELEALLKQAKDEAEQLSQEYKAKSEEISKKHSLETDSLKQQITILNKQINSTVGEDIDIVEIGKEIMDAFEVFKSDGIEDRKHFDELVYSILKRAVDCKLKQFNGIHQEKVKELTQSWQQKIKDELSKQKQAFQSQVDQYRKESHSLKKGWEKEKKNLIAEKDSFWQQKLKETEKALKEHHKRQTNTVIAKLKQEHEIREKDLKSSHENEKEALKIKFEMRVQLAEERLTYFDNQKHQLEAAHKSEIDELQSKLYTQLQDEKNQLQVQHKEHLVSMHNFFQAKWKQEMQKLRAFQKEILQSGKSEEQQLKAIQTEYESKVSKLNEQIFKHQVQLQQLQQSLEENFKNENQKSLKIKEETLEKQFNKKFEAYKKKWEDEKSTLIKFHDKEIIDLKSELSTKIDETKLLEEAYKQQLKEAQRLIREAKFMTISGSSRSDSSSNQMSTPSDATSSSDEMNSLSLSTNMKRIRQDGKEVLSMVQMHCNNRDDVTLWLEEREWIINRLKTIATGFANRRIDLKEVIDNLIEEIEISRKELEKSRTLEMRLREKRSHMQQQLNSEIHDLGQQLMNQRRLNSHLENVISSLESELKERRAENRGASFISLQEKTPIGCFNNGGGDGNHVSPEGVEYLRSSDIQRSLDYFSPFQPEIDLTSMRQKMQTDSQFLENVEFPVPPIALDSVKHTEHQSSSLYAGSIQSISHPSVVSIDGKDIDVTDDRLHGLWWRYRRSQSYQRALVYQKKYLIRLLKGFMATEKMTLAWIRRMDGGSDENISSGINGPKRNLFRVAAYVIIAIGRMKNIVRRWQFLAMLPAYIVNKEVEYVLHTPVLSPNQAGCGAFSNSTESSKTTSEAKRDHSHHSSNFRNTRPKELYRERNPVPDKAQLYEYKKRLELLHQQLGLGASE